MTNKKIKYQPIQPKVLEWTAAHGNSPEAVLEVLQDLQTEHGGLSRQAVTDTARALGLPAHHVHGMATFYSMLSLEERKRVLRVCDGPVCWLKRASEQSSVISWLRSGRKKLGMNSPSSGLPASDSATARPRFWWTTNRWVPFPRVTPHA